MIAKDPVQEVLKAAKGVLSNVDYEGEIPVTTTFNDASDRYIMLTIPSTDEDSTDDHHIYDVTLRVEVITEFITGEEREMVSNKIMEQVTELLSDLEYFNAMLNNFNIPLIYPLSGSRGTEQENVSSLIIKRKDFNLKVQQL